MPSSNAISRKSLGSLSPAPRRWSLLSSTLGSRQRAGRGARPRSRTSSAPPRAPASSRRCSPSRSRPVSSAPSRAPGPLTVFAPDGRRLQGRPEGDARQARAPTSAALRRVLLYHVVKGNVTAARVVKLRSATTLAGPPISDPRQRRRPCSSTARRRSSRPTSARATAPSTSSTRCSCRRRSSGIRHDDAAGTARRIVVSPVRPRGPSVRRDRGASARAPP